MSNCVNRIYHVPRRVSRRSIDFGVIFSGKSSASVAAPSAVRVDDDFLAGQSRRALGTADDKPMEEYSNDGSIKGMKLGDNPWPRNRPMSRKNLLCRSYLPLGCKYTVVFSSMYSSGMTGLITCSCKCCLIVAKSMASSC